MLNHEQIKGKWTEIKGGVRNLWGHITDDELEKTQGDFAAISGMVQEKYGESKEDIKHKLDTLMDSFDNETDKNFRPSESSDERSRFDQSSKTAKKAENVNFGTSEVDDDDEYEGEEIFDDTQDNDKTYEAKSSGLHAEDRISRH